jgi:hypothetical protein
MKNIGTRAVVVSVVLLIATFTQPAAALPRYSYSDIYYSGTWTQLSSKGGMWCADLENGRDSLSCSGVREQTGTLDGRFWYAFQYECSSHEVIVDQWYFKCDFSPTCQAQGWIPVSSTCVYGTYEW